MVKLKTMYMHDTVSKTSYYYVGISLDKNVLSKMLVLMGEINYNCGEVVLTLLCSDHQVLRQYDPFLVP